jgi:hypothetical protein
LNFRIIGKESNYEKGRKGDRERAEYRARRVKRKNNFGLVSEKIKGIDEF